MPKISKSLTKKTAVKAKKVATKIKKPSKIIKKAVTNDEKTKRYLCSNSSSFK